MKRFTQCHKQIQPKYVTSLQAYVNCQYVKCFQTTSRASIRHNDSAVGRATGYWMTTEGSEFESR
jgi:hypothetical protein